MADSASFLVSILADLVSGRSPWKLPVKVVATSNVTQSGTQTIDGVALAADDEVLCVGQTASSQNGIWVVKASGWQRRTDAASNAKYTQLFAGVRCPVQQGTAGAGSIYRLTTTGTIRIGITSQAWEVDSQTSGVGVSGSVDDVPAMVSQFVVRDSSGDADFHALDVGVNIDVGVAADGTYTRIQNTTPTAMRQVSTASDGRLRVYAEGAARSCPTFYDVPQEGDLPKLADSIPGDVMAERVLFTGSPYDIPSAFVSFWPDAPLTADDTNYAEFTIRVRDGAGSPADFTGAATTQTAGGGGTDDWDAFVAVPLVSGISVPAGAIVTVEMEKILAGVSVPSGKFKFHGRRAS